MVDSWIVRIKVNGRAEQQSIFKPLALDPLQADTVDRLQLHNEDKLFLRDQKVC
jgi:hypothetical protein